MKVEYIEEFKTNTKYKYSKQEAINYIKEKGYGAVIGYEELGNIFGLSINDELSFHRLKTVVSHLKPILIEHGIVLKTILNVGYYILKPKQISGYCYHTYIRRTQNLLQKSEKILNHVDLSELSDIRLTEHKQVKALNKDVDNSIEMAIYRSDYEKNKEFYDNLQD